MNLGDLGAASHLTGVGGCKSNSATWYDACDPCEIS